jgi:hypothetical protein
VNEWNNYDFLPFDIGNIVSASGNYIELANPMFSELFKEFKSYLEYKAYFENIVGDHKVLFTAKDKNRVLGAIFTHGQGHLIVLPTLEYDNDDFTETETDDEGEETTIWTKEAMQFGARLANQLVKIDSAIKQKSASTPPPDWSSDKKYRTKKELELISLRDKEQDKITEAQSRIEKYNDQLSKEVVLLGLLFEQGEPLETAVILALEILGYKAEGYDDGTLELDQVITSPELHRYIGECEGKDNKDIDITKYRQLSESLTADFHRDEVEEKAFGILFGNPQRFVSPEKRTLDFTQKCKIGAARDGIALVKTSDLFDVVKYLSDFPNEDFKKKCREAIHASLGKIVVFPPIPSKSRSTQK